MQAIHTFHNISSAALIAHTATYPTAAQELRFPATWHDTAAGPIRRAFAGSTSQHWSQAAASIRRKPGMAPAVGTRCRRVHHATPTAPIPLGHCEARESPGGIRDCHDQLLMTRCEAAETGCACVTLLRFCGPAPAGLARYARQARCSSSPTLDDGCRHRRRSGLGHRDR